MTQFQENARTDGQTLLYRTFPATVGGPKWARRAEFRFYLKNVIYDELTFCFVWFYFLNFVCFMLFVKKLKIYGFWGL